MPDVMVMLILAALAVESATLFFGGGHGFFHGGDYRAKPLMTRWELTALRQIRADLPLGYHVCPQVRLGDMLDMSACDPRRRQAALARVASKSVDFAIADPLGRVALVIELDDRTHDRADRRARDRFVDAVLGECGIPVLRVRPGEQIDVRSALAGAVEATGLDRAERGFALPAAGLAGGGPSRLRRVTRIRSSTMRLHPPPRRTRLKGRRSRPRVRRPGGRAARAGFWPPSWVGPGIAYRIRLTGGAGPG